MTKKIVITGIGATTPIGGTARDSWNALLAGESGARTLEHEWVEKYELPVKFAATARIPAADVLERHEVKRLDPSSQFALIAGREAWADAGAPEVAPERLAIDWATGIGGVWTLLDAWDTLREKGARERGRSRRPGRHRLAPGADRCRVGALILRLAPRNELDVDGVVRAEEHPRMRRRIGRHGALSAGRVRAHRDLSVGAGRRGRGRGRRARPVAPEHDHARGQREEPRCRLEEPWCGTAVVR